MRIDLPVDLQVAQELADLFGAIFVMKGEAPHAICGISTDTRELREGDLFLALRGERTNGALFLQEALNKGASALLVSSEVVLPCGNYCALVCEDCEAALLRAAGEYRRRIGARVIAITGSAGKTTAKEAISSVLGGVPHNAENYNSGIGMPLSVLSFPKADVWVCELGINHVGEMERMSRALSPDVALITNVGDAHIGNFGNYLTLVTEKLMISKGLREGGFLLVPSELGELCACGGAYRTFTFGENAELGVENIFMDQNGVRCDFCTSERVITNLAWPIAGRIGLGVIAACAAVGFLFGRSDQQIRMGLLHAGAHAPRMKSFYVRERLVLEDCYNASPRAVVAAMESLRYMAAGRACVAVLGDMLELGAHSRSLHYELGEELVHCGVGALFTCGCAAYEIARGALHAGMPASLVHCFAGEEIEELANAVWHKTPRNCAILIKASHAMHFERVGEALRRMS